MAPPEAAPIVPIRASESKVVAAPPVVVHQVLSDYHAHHANILPKPEFESLAVEKGGVGAGTVIVVGMKVMGARSRLRMSVTEPHPGRVLREEDKENGVVTTFTLTPMDKGRQTRVEIATEWTRKPGFRGWVESKMNPRVASRLYRRQLDLIDEYARKLK